MDFNSILSRFTFNPESPINFTVFDFWIFFAFVLLALTQLHNRIAIRNFFLFVVSIFFYYKTSGLFFLLLLFSTVTDYYIGNWVYTSKSDTQRKWLISLSVFINLATLVYFKYAYFFTDSYNKIFSTNHKAINWLAQWSNEFAGTGFSVDKIVLPVGVSFFTFQTISYSIDIYRKQIKPVKSIWDFGFFVSYFPQLVAGPIVRANEFVDQIYQPYRVTRYEMGLAIFWILNGLIKKMVLGDYLALNFIDRVFDYPENYTGFGVLMALFTYSLQVYADFSGYTDIAIGVSLLIGFRLPMNFNSPYKAKNVAEFWRRWHMSLSTWLKDYLYIPLGGNKKGTLGTYLWTILILLFIVLISGQLILLIIFPLVGLGLFLLSRIFPAIQTSITTNINLMITMLLGGLWHGASWNFLIWGGLNGVALLVYKAWKNVSPYESSNHPIVVAWKVFFTFTFISFTRLFFRAADVQKLEDPMMASTESMKIVSRMWNQLIYNFDVSIIPTMLVEYKDVFLLFAFGMFIHWLPTDIKMSYRKAFTSMPFWAQVGISVVVILVMYQFISSEGQAFIYFQF